MSSTSSSDFSDDILEKLLFKKLYTDVKYISAVADVYDTRWFEQPSMAHLSLLMIKYYQKYNAIPSRKVLLALVKKYSESHPDISVESSHEALLDIESFNLGVTEQVNRDNISYFVKKRALTFSILDNIKTLEENQSIDACLKRFEKFQNFTFDDNLGLNYRDDMDRHWDFIMNPESKISTGWDSLDDITNGGFLRTGKSLYIFMGQPGLGKSTFLSNITLNFLKQNLTVVVISLEMSEDVYAMRFDAHISGDNINQLNLTAESSRQKIKKFCCDDYPKSNLFIKEFPPRTIKSSDISLYLDKIVAAGYKPDVIVVDYLNLVRPQHSNSKSTMYEDVLAVSENLRALSYKYAAPVVTATQTNTEGIDNENVSMKHVSESRGMAHTVDFMAGLYQNDDDRDNGIINVKILKNRLGGKVGKVLNMKLNKDTLTLTDITMSSADISEGDRIIRDVNSIDHDIGNL